jgi:hypothetical protein
MPGNDSHRTPRARNRLNVVRKKKAQKFLSSKHIRSDQRKYDDVKGRISVLKAFAEVRDLTPAEGRELNSLAKKLRKLERSVRPRESFVQ